MPFLRYLKSYIWDISFVVKNQCMLLCHTTIKKKVIPVMFPTDNVYVTRSLRFSAAWISVKLSQLNHQCKRWATALENIWFFDLKSQRTVYIKVHKDFGVEVNGGKKLNITFPICRFNQFTFHFWATSEWIQQLQRQVLFTISATKCFELIRCDLSIWLAYSP